MALLAAFKIPAGSWDVYIVEGRTDALDPDREGYDALGRCLPSGRELLGICEVAWSERLRLANELKGMSIERRQQFFTEWAEARNVPKKDKR